jgi:hypothetical protein
MQPQIALIARQTTEQHMEKWTSLSPRLGTNTEFKFTADFFAWWRRNLIVIEDFPYAEVDFWGSVDLVLLEGIEWDVSGTKTKPCHVFFFIYFILFLCVQRAILTDVLFHHADRGTSHPTEMSTLGRHGDVQIVVDHEVAGEDSGRLRGTSEVSLWVSHLSGGKTYLFIYKGIQ